MKHGIKKVKFRRGQDANQAVVRKLALNFLKHGKIETTLLKAKTLKGVMDKLSYKSRMKRESDKNVLLKYLGDINAVQKMFDEVGPTFKKRTGGFVNIVKLGKRQGDDAEMARLEWTKEIESKTKQAHSKKIDKKINKEKDVKVKPIKK